MNTILKTRSEKDYLTVLIKNLVIRLDVVVSFSSIESAVKNHPLYPNLFNLNDVLNEWGIFSKSVKTSFEDLMCLQTPLLARMNAPASPYLLITSVDKYSITCIDPLEGERKFNSYLFKQDWNGQVDYFELSSNCGEKKYKESTRNEKKSRIEHSILVLAPVFLASLLFLLGLKQELRFIEWMLFIVGLLAGFLQSVQSSNSSFGSLPFVYAGHWVFALSGLLVTQINVTFTLLSVLITIQLIATLKSFLYMHCKWGFSIVFLKLILPFILLLLSFRLALRFELPDVFGWILCLQSYFISIVLWQLYKTNTRKTKGLTDRLNRLQIYKHPQISRQLFVASPIVNIPRRSFPIFCGEENANLQLTLFVSLSDGVSGTRFLQLRKLMNELSGLRFIVQLVPDNILSSQATGCMLAYRSDHTPDQTMQLIENWYRYESKDVHSFASDNQVFSSDRSLIEKIIEEQQSMMQSISGLSIPSLFINGRRVPEYFEWEDILYLIRYDPLRDCASVRTEKEKFWKDSRPIYAE
jgi:hypothetical protein